MNARLIETAPETLHRQAETATAVGLLFLETSGKYFDLQVGALKSSLDALRAQMSVFPPQADVQQVVNQCNTLLTHAINESGDLLRQSASLSADSQRQMSQLIDQSWSQMKELARHTTDAQLALARSLATSLTAGQTKS